MSDIFIIGLGIVLGWVLILAIFFMSPAWKSRKNKESNNAFDNFSGR